MKISRTSLSRAAFAAVLLAGAAIPVLAQDHPESLLPPGFDQPTAPAPAPAPAPQSTRAPSAAPQPSESTSPSEGPIGNSAAAAQAGPAEDVDLSRYELPDYAKHSLDRIGISAWGNAPFPAHAFGRADGRFLTALMRRVDAPVVSRWASIALRRALQSRVDTPRNVNGADFAADRAWLLVRMGEAIAARGVVQDVDVENYTPELYQVAMQVYLANGDPAGLCPIADKGAETSSEPAWPLARAMCAGLAGQPDRAGELFDAAGGKGDIDTLLAEKILGTGAKGRRAVTIEWDGVQQLTSWRWGLATATGETVPEELYASVGPQVRYWRALSPRLDPDDRVPSAELAAAQGVFSSEGLVNLYGEVEEQGDASTTLIAVARDLRSAFTAATQEDRLKALNTLWSESDNPRSQYARMVLTARAAAGVPPSGARAQDAEKLIASMLTAGYDGQAMGWWSVVPRGSQGWAMLALADPGEGLRISTSDFGSYQRAAGQRKAQLALAGLAGLGRFDPSEAARQAASLDVPIGAANSWTRAIDNAARRGDSGSVALLAAVGMQTRNWDRVTPEALFHIIAAFRAVGLGNYARMIAVEAITRT